MKYSKGYLNYKIIKSMARFKFESPVLEVGCGMGDGMEAIAEYYNIKGVDLSDEAVSRCLEKRLDVKRDNFLNITENFNSIVCTYVLEHIKDDYAFVGHMYKILNDKGKVFIMVPSGKIMNDDLLCGHYRRYSREGIVRVLERSNFNIETVEMFGYPIIYYTRLIMNFAYRLRVEKDLDLETRTLRSSYENPFDKTLCARVFARLSKNRFISGLLMSILSLQDIFSNSNKGWAVVVVASKP